MSEFHTHRLDGCTPTPLAGYLKALGVLRLLASPDNNAAGAAADPTARGWWENERFHLKTRLDGDALLRYFLEDYAPSPIIAPWNGRAGFLEGDAGPESSRTGAQLMRAIEASRAKRLEGIRTVIATLRKEPMLVQFDELRAAAKAAGEEEKRATGEARKAASERRRTLTRQAEATKSALLPNLRSNADARHLQFIDACFVLADDERAAPLLGSGGNDGSRDFGVNFAEALQALFDFDSGAPAAPAATELEAAILGAARPLATRGSIGQFGPGQGGPNGSTGYEGWNPLNRWDVLLVLEGTLIFVGALTRRWGVGGSGRAAFPFTFEPSRAGTGALSTEDPNAPRGEIWTPLWGKPSSLPELQALFAEGRLTVGRATARTGLDAARAVASLGVSRGLAAFERYSMIQPDTKMPYQGTPLGRFSTPRRPRRDLVADLDAGNWLARLRNAAGKGASARARIAVRRLDDALFRVARDGARPETLQNVLIALGDVASWLATSPDVREMVPPPPRLGGEWVRAADDRSAEFRIAAALASLGWREEPQRGEPAEEEHDETASDAQPEGVADASLATVDARRPGAEDSARRPNPLLMAAHFAPVDETTIAHRFRRWAGEDPRTVVWGAGSLVQNMIAVLERRLVEQPGRRLDDKPLESRTSAELWEISAFLGEAADFDEARCAALLAGLVWAQPGRLAPRHGDDQVPLPFAYAALKPLFTCDRDLRAGSDLEVNRRQFLPANGTLPIPPGLLARIRRGDVEGGVRQALARARASGIVSPFAAATRLGGKAEAARLAAALLIPISEIALTQLMNRAYPEDRRKEETNDAT